MADTTRPTCVSCGAALSGSARFCHACGAKQETSQRSFPPVLIGLVTLAVVMVVAVVAYSVGRSSQPAAATQPAPVGGAGGAAPDISNLSPREQADRLFNIVMSAHEQGDAARMNQFAPMAVQAYGLLGALDPDAHYHVGLMSAVSGNQDEARARADSIEAAVPNHLLALMLRSSVAQMQGDQAQALALQRKFLDVYDAQMATQRREYLDHQAGIEGFKQQAEQSVRGGPGS
ncbi:MAG: zinc ribbon domain-containing protein [Gemmatimonadota bacterium]|nr:zinc ribbon domain-containing protein [Gemmatimonadota bacterium]MDH3479556.1 zinc ribbon domain-containing protein [Gemmatimonadota bacterium]MDH5551403.1 zinc ribbon domain-containing protein [Gemmatimonadota bacterium]